ncbi:MAG: DNA-directed RNA polymerase subunit omega [Thermodesulfobacteriota bacterium]
MARITVEDCLSKIGNENRFRLVHLAVARLRQHRKGLPFLVKTRNKEAVATLREIAAGKVNFDNIRDFNKLPDQEGHKVDGSSDTVATDKSG